MFEKCPIDSNRLPLKVQDYEFLFRNYKYIKQKLDIFKFSNKNLNIFFLRDTTDFNSHTIRQSLYMSRLLKLTVITSSLLMGNIDSLLWNCHYKCLKFIYY